MTPPPLILPPTPGDLWALRLSEDPGSCSKGYTYYVHGHVLSYGYLFMYCAMTRNEEEAKALNQNNWSTTCVKRGREEMQSCNCRWVSCNAPHTKMDTSECAYHHPLTERIEQMESELARLNFCHRFGDLLPEDPTPIKPC